MRLALVLAVAACGDGTDDVVGPFTGTVHRYVMDAIEVPREAVDADAVAEDLDGDGKPDNKFGYATAVLASIMDLSTHAPDMIASGALATIVEIQADDLTSDDAVGVRYLGADGDPAGVIGGSIVDGVFTPNRVASDHPGSAIVRVPVFVNADPVALPIDRLALALVPDATGFQGSVRGAIDERTARETGLAGLLQMFETEPERHLVFQRGVDENHDDVVSYEELEVSVLGLLVEADVEIAGEQLVSFAYRLHLVPCPSGTCATGTPVNTCRDRARSAGETDIDCGGPCQPCATGKSCSAPTDCQSNACDAGACRAPTCSDGVKDGYESDIDCGGACPTCAPGAACAADRDCSTNNCNNSVAMLGTCQ